MGRKKKAEIQPEEEGFKFEAILHSDAKRSIAAVFLFALSVLFLLGFFDAAGVVGQWLDRMLGLLFGWGKWLFPFLLITAGLMFLKRRTTTLADAVKFIGLTLAFFATLGLWHLFVGGSTRELLKIAQAGRGGGYIGFALSALFLNFTGKAAGTILLFAFFLAGVIAAFNVSLINHFERMKERLRKPEAADNASEESSIAGAEQSAVPSQETAPVTQIEAEELKRKNIQNLQFKDDGEPEGSSVGEKPLVFSDEPEATQRRVRRNRRVGWELPGVDLLDSEVEQASGGDTERNKQVIQSTLRYFGIEVEPGEVRQGPTVTQYTFRPAVGVKLSRITTLSDDLTLALAAQAIRIEAPIPGQSLIGIEVPNKTIAKVRLRASLESTDFKQRKSDLMMMLGHDVSGSKVFADLEKMPHILIAGRTGSGKSVCINSILMSLLYQNTPEDLKLILVDPKRVELAAYKGIAHLKSDVFVENKKVINALRWAVGEMDRRYRVLEDAHSKDIRTYREKYHQGETRTIVDERTSVVRNEPLESLPYIVIVIDEMAELMLAHGKEVEPLIVRLAQLSRAVGIHLVLATQRPEVTVITGLIKANIPARISFQLKSQIDSRTILDAGGAEKLLGNGDMLYASADGKDMRRIQGVFVSDAEVRRVTQFLRKQKEDLGEDEIGDDFGGAEKEENSIDTALEAMDDGSEADPLYERARQVVIETGRPSTTYLQTALGIGYPRGARLMMLLEENGVIGMVDGKKKVLIGKVAEQGGMVAVEEEQSYGDEHLSEQKERDKWQL